MCCNGSRDYSEESVKDGALLDDRHCTDICCIFIFLVFFVGWVVILAVAVTYGQPIRLIYPTNFRGELCGDEGPLKELPNLFIPLPNRLSYGICVHECPAFLDFVCNSDEEPKLSDVSVNVQNTYYDHTEAEFNTGQAALKKCATACSTAELAVAKRFAGLVVKVKESKCFPVYYTSSPTVMRCLPFEVDVSKNSTLLDSYNKSSGQLGEISNALGVGSFFTRGFGELQQCWVTMAICCATACVVSLIWIILLRWVLAPIVYTAIILIFVVFMIVGALAMLQANNLEDVQLPGETGTEGQVKFWRAVEFGSFVGGAMYLVIVLVLLKRIRIAIVLMEESSKAFQANPSLIILPPLVLLLLCGFVAFFVVTTVYIQTIGSFEPGMVNAAASSALGDDIVGSTDMGAVVGPSYDVTPSTGPANVTTFNTSGSAKLLHAYNFFGFLWMANFCIMLAFFIMALVISTWYYSATGVEIDQYDQGNDEVGREKSTKAGTFLKSLCVALRYHLGTILFGSFLIALIQFIRAVVLYIEKEYLDKWKNNATVKILLYLINCCLECIERIVRIISRSAFVICCIKNTSFCPSAVETMAILLANFARVGALQVLSTASCFLLKCFIVGCNCLIGFALLQFDAINDDRPVQSGLFPLIGIFIFSFAIASLFVNVFESCVDTIMVCFFVDETTFEGKFMPPNLAKILDQFKHIEEARLKYDEQLRNAGNLDNAEKS